MISRLLLASAAACSLMLAAPAVSHAESSKVGLRFPSEKSTYLDPATGFPVTVLTNNRDRNVRIYQTHPQWTKDERHIIYRSDRGGYEAIQIFAVNEGSGEIIQLTDDPRIAWGNVIVSRQRPVLYFLKVYDRLTEIYELDLGSLFADSAAGTSQVKGQPAYERLVAQLPEGLGNAGGITLDADGSTLYMGVDRVGEPQQLFPPEGQSWRVGQIPGGIRAVDVRTGEWSHVIDVPFKIGHIQANPWVPGEIVYCHETGGDAPQRMWVTRRDGSENRPLFVEGPHDWVTHEIYAGPDEVIFNLLGFQPRLRQRPTGIAVVNLRTEAVRLLGEVEERVPAGFLGEGGPGGFWHCAASPDGRWAAGDTFRGDLYLINRRSGEMTLLSTGHLMRPDHIHPYFSADSSRILMQSGRLTDGANLNLMVVTIPQSLRR
jgi:oligogalacturonide lyase